MPSWFTGFFFDSWSGLLRVVVVGVLAYAALIIGLRLSGKRTLSKMNAFDLVVTVALGSTLATIILSHDVALGEGVLAFILLIVLQYLITWLSVRSQRFSEFIKSEPTLVFFRGRYLPRQMRAVRIVKAEILAAIRARGIADLDEVEAVVLESDGSRAMARSRWLVRDGSFAPMGQPVRWRTSPGATGLDRAGRLLMGGVGWLDHARLEGLSGRGRFARYGSVSRNPSTSDTPGPQSPRKTPSSASRGWWARSRPCPGSARYRSPNVHLMRDFLSDPTAFLCYL